MFLDRNGNKDRNWIDLNCIPLQNRKDWMYKMKTEQTKEKWNVDSVEMNRTRKSSKLAKKEDKNKHEWVEEMLD